MDLAMRQPPPGISKSGTGVGVQEKVVWIALGYATGTNGKPPPVPKARVDCNLRSERQRRVLLDEVTQLARQLLDSGVTRLSEREQRVILHIAKRSHIARNVNRSYGGG
jgi:hypothetical protein